MWTSVIVTIFTKIFQALLTFWVWFWKVLGGYDAAINYLHVAAR